MELTPELLLEAKFGPSRRGYDMEEVDDFLERVAQALEVLTGRLTDEFSRAERAEAELAAVRAELAELREVTAKAEQTPASDSGGASEAAPTERPALTADEPMRILIHAERTAEAVVAEARAEAERLAEEAETSATAMRTEAEAMLHRARNDAEAEARKAGEATRRAVQDEVNALRTDRDQLAADVRTFKRWVDENRARVRTAVRDLQRIVDDPNALRDAGIPTANGTAPDEATADDGEPTMATPVVPDDLRAADEGAIDEPEAVVDVTSQPAAAGSDSTS